MTKRNLTFPTLATCSSILLLGLFSQTWSQETEPTQKPSSRSVKRRRNDPALLDRKVRHLRIEGATVPECVLFLGSRIRFAYGIEVVPIPGSSDEKLLKHISLDLSNVTFGEILDSLVSQNPAYGCAIADDGFIRVYPAYSTREKDYLLTLPIASFRAEGIDLENAVWKLAALLTEMSRGKFSCVSQVCGTRTDREGDPILLNMKRQNTTAREILDTLARKFDESWMVSPGCDGKCLSIAMGNEPILRKELADAATISF